MKRFLCCLLSLMLLASVPVLAQAEDEVTVQLLATSDLHGWFVPWDFSEDVASTRGSLTYLATLIKKYKAENPNTIYVDDGDLVQANYVEYFIDHDKNPMIEALNHLGCEVFTFGNHEYNFNFAQRQKLIEQLNAVSLSGNVLMKDTHQPYLPATTVVERGGVKIGFVGMTTPLIVEFEKGKPNLDEVDVLNPLDVIGSAIEELKAQQVDCIVGLIHEGLEEENSVKGSGTKDIAEAFPEFDVIISGHAHVAVESETVNGVLLCEPNYHGRSLSVLQLKFAKDGEHWKLTEKSAKLDATGNEEDPELAALMAPYQQELSAYVNTPIGKLINHRLNADMAVPGIMPANMATVPVLNLMSTAGCYYSGADFTIYNPTYDNPGFDIGDISIKSISSSFQFTGGEVTLYPINGRQLKKILEYCGAFFNQVQEGDLTISYDPVRRDSKYSTYFVGGGITYTLDVTKPVGERVGNLALILKDKHCNPILNADGSLMTTAILDDTVLKMGAHSYYIRKWSAEGGCIEGENIQPIYSTSEEYGDDGTVRNLTVRYIKEHLNGIVDGDLYQYGNWHVVSGIDTTTDTYQTMLKLLEEGKLELPADEKGHNNIRSITVADVEAAMK